MNVGQKKTRADKYSKKEFQQICQQLPKWIKVWHLYEENISMIIMINNTSYCFAYISAPWNSTEGFWTPDKPMDPAFDMKYIPNF